MTSARQPIVDLHAHYPMHLPLSRRAADPAWRTALQRAAFALANRWFNRHCVAVRADLARQAHVSFGSVLYHPADEFFDGRDAFDTILRQMTAVEEDFAARDVPLARSPRALRDLLRQARPCAFHCIEGGHAIGDLANVATLAARGVAYVTVAHLVYRGVSACVNAIPIVSDAVFSRLFRMPCAGLSAYGEELCAGLMDHGVIVDITHMTGEALGQVLAIARVKRRPVIASHTGVRATAAPDYLLNLSDDAIRGIHATGGVVGVLVGRHWLRRRREHTDDVTLVVRVMDHLKQVTGSADVIAIGSDFDGFLRPVRGLNDVGDLPGLESALRERGYAAHEVQAIFSGNALRALSLGWGR